MSIAVDRDATRLWILNVGDLKPYERETEFFISYGWNATRWSPENINTYVPSWAQREFDLAPAAAGTVSDIVGNLTRFNARRKPELLNATTFSLISYREYVVTGTSNLLSNLIAQFIERKLSLRRGQNYRKHLQPFTILFQLT